MHGGERGFAKSRISRVLNINSARNLAQVAIASRQTTLHSKFPFAGGCEGGILRESAPVAAIGKSTAEVFPFMPSLPGKALQHLRYEQAIDEKMMKRFSDLSAFHEAEMRSQPK